MRNELLAETRALQERVMRRLAEDLDPGEREEALAALDRLHEIEAELLETEE